MSTSTWTTTTSATGLPTLEPEPSRKRSTSFRNLNQNNLLQIKRYVIEPEGESNLVSVKHSQLTIVIVAVLVPPALVLPKGALSRQLLYQLECFQKYTVPTKTWTYLQWKN